jgi:hypothetical protein
MTIVVAAISSEGIVLASDSRTTEQLNSSQRRVASESAQKVFEACGKFGVATYGLAMIGSKTIRGLFDEWVVGLKAEPKSIDDFADELGRFFVGQLPAIRGPGGMTPGGWTLGFLVAAYDEDGNGRVIEVKVRPTDHTSTALGSTQDGPAVWYRGQTSAIRRLVRGVDLDEMREHHFQFDDELGARLETLHYQYVGPTTTQDAIDLAYFLIEVTIQMQRFTDGTVVAWKRDGRGPVRGCGGPVQALAIEPRAITWVAQNNPRAPTPDASDLD